MEKRSTGVADTCFQAGAKGEKVSPVCPLEINDPSRNSRVQCLKHMAFVVQGVGWKLMTPAGIPGAVLKTCEEEVLWYKVWTGN